MSVLSTRRVVACLAWAGAVAVVPAMALWAPAGRSASADVSASLGPAPDSGVDMAVEGTAGGGVCAQASSDRHSVEDLRLVSMRGSAPLGRCLSPSTLAGREALDVRVSAVIDGHPELSPLATMAFLSRPDRLRLTRPHAVRNGAR